MSNKITKIAMIEAIEEFLLERNQRLTNLKKISYERLEQRVNEFNIDMNKFVKERNEKLNKEKEERKQKKIKENEEYQEILDRNEKIEKTRYILDLYIKDIENKLIYIEQLKKTTPLKVYYDRDMLFNRFYELNIYFDLVDNFNKFKEADTIIKEAKRIKRVEEQRIKEEVEEIKEEVKEEVKEEKPSTKNDKFLCSCGSYCRKDNKARHIKTVKHQEYLKSL